MPEEIVYLLRNGAGQVLASYLGLDEPPAYVRLSTLAPLSNYGYPEGTEGSVLALSDLGIVVGVEGRPEAPRLFVPWQNVAYLADGAGLQGA